MPSAYPRVAMTVEQLWQPVPGGSGTYIRELSRALRAGAEAEIVGVAARGHGGDHHDLGIPVIAAALPRRWLYEAWNTARRPRLSRACGAVDLIHATTWAIPPRSRPLVVTIHDLAFLRTPEHFTRRGNSYFRRALDVARNDADLVIVPSSATADDCLEHGFASERLRIVPHGVRPETVTPGEIADFRTRTGLHGPYVLWCGTFEPRKNVAALIEAFASVAARDASLSLVLAGPVGWGGTSRDVARLLTGDLAGRVITPGRLTATDLRAAYAGAQAFCFPSLWEGFGMPVLEAMSHGTPVVTSEGTSMAEFARGAALLVDPRDPDALADAILSATGERHAELATASTARAREYTWDRTARLTADAYRSVI